MITPKALKKADYPSYILVFRPQDAQDYMKLEHVLSKCRPLEEHLVALVVDAEIPIKLVDVEFVKAGRLSVEEG